MTRTLHQRDQWSIKNLPSIDLFIHGSFFHDNNNINLFCKRILCTSRISGGILCFNPKFISFTCIRPFMSASWRTSSAYQSRGGRKKQTLMNEQYNTVPDSATFSLCPAEVSFRVNSLCPAAVTSEL